MSEGAPPTPSAPKRRAARSVPANKPRAPKSGPPSQKPRLRSERGRAAFFARRKALLWISAALAGTLAIGAAMLYLGYGRGHTPPKVPGGAVEVEWPAGLTSEQAAARLVELGLAESHDTLAIFLTATGGTSDFVPGFHLLPYGASPWDLRRMLGRSFFRPGVKCTIPEGYNRFDIAARLEKLHIAGKRGFLAASADPAVLTEAGVDPLAGIAPESAEGYLFPATYELGLDSDPREIVKRLVQESNKRWDILLAPRKDGLASLKASLGWGRREVLTVASIIEKEAAVDEDRPLIASVFLNRLIDPDFKPKRLQSDPTSSYGCIAFPAEAPSCEGFAGKPTPAMNRDPANRYSTYTRNGLPPGPISNPGMRSIEAVLAPATTKFFYFYAAAGGGGRHTFSQDYGTHTDVIQRGKTP